MPGPVATPVHKSPNNKARREGWILLSIKRRDRRDGAPNRATDNLNQNVAAVIGMSEGAEGRRSMRYRPVAGVLHRGWTWWCLLIALILEKIGQVLNFLARSF